MDIFDTHLHLIHLDRFSYPWLNDAPTLNQQADAAAYFAKAQALGITRALHMEVDVAEKDMEAETAFVTQCHSQIVGAIAACRPEHSDFASMIERLAGNPSVKGVRRILHTSPDELSQSQVFVDNIRRLSAFDLSFDLCVRADQLSIGAQLVKACPDVQFILDHCGVPDITGTGLDPWRDQITEIAQLPNLVAKISGVVAYAGHDWKVEDIRPYVEHVISAFGWDRVVWGSDYPVCTLTGTLERWVGATKEIISGASTDEQAQLLRINAEKLFGN